MVLPLFRGSLPNPRCFPQMYMLIKCSAENLRGTFCRSPEHALSFSPPPALCSSLCSGTVPWTLVTLASPNSPLCLLRETTPSSFWPGNALQAVSWGSDKAHLFLSFWGLHYRITCCWMYKKHFHAFFWVFSCLRWEGKTGSDYPLMVKMFHLGFWLELMGKIDTLLNLSFQEHGIFI